MGCVENVELGPMYYSTHHSAYVSLSFNLAHLPTYNSIGYTTVKIEHCVLENYSQHFSPVFSHIPTLKLVGWVNSPSRPEG